VDLSRFNNTPNVRSTVKERYLWELISPSDDDQLATAQAGRFRTELHDRLLAPIYPIVFVIVTYMFLGPPRTNRQSRNLSTVAAIGSVATLRLSGFASTIVGVHVPSLLLVQYGILAAATGFGIFAISRGMIIEPPAFATQVAATLAERFAKRAGMATAVR
jgi:lipopolysaccharide export system permease protein